MPGCKCSPFDLVWTFSLLLISHREREIYRLLFQSKPGTIKKFHGCINDDAKLWNHAPVAIKTCKTLGSAKTQIKLFIQSLPL